MPVSHHIPTGTVTQIVLSVPSPAPSPAPPPTSDCGKTLLPRTHLLLMQSRPVRCLVVSLSAVLVALSPAPNQAAPTRPNVVIIYGDDVGFGDIGVNGSTLIPTPNIDRLAAEGINFTDGHCTASTCTPSRFSLLTGIHAFRYGARVLPPDAPLIIPTDILTLPKLFQRAGYDTAVVGKWHLGIGERGVPTDWNSAVKPGPLELGFNYSFLLPSTNDRVPSVYLRNHHVVNLNPNDPLFVGKSAAAVNRPGSTAYPDGRVNRAAMTYYPSSHGHDESVINGIGRMGYMAGGKSALWNDETLTDTFVEEAKTYLAAKAQKHEPFFLYFSAQDIHVPRAPHPRFQGKTALGYRGDAMVQFDWATGEIMAALETHGLADNTIVIFSSDNGPVYDDGYEDGTTVHCSLEESDRGHDGSGVYRGGKYQIYEGGTRVPFIVRWPDQIKPATSAATVNQVDLLASLAALLQIDLAADEAMDSRNTLGTLLGQNQDGVHTMVEESFDLALRQGDWKYVEASQATWPANAPFVPEALYDLKTDPSEQTNVMTQHPARVVALKKLLAEIKTGRPLRGIK